MVNIPIEKGAAPGQSHGAHQKCGWRNDNDTRLGALALPKEDCFFGKDVRKCVKGRTQLRKDEGSVYTRII